MVKRERRAAGGGEGYVDDGADADADAADADAGAETTDVDAELAALLAEPSISSLSDEVRSRHISALSSAILSAISAELAQLRPGAISAELARSAERLARRAGHAVVRCPGGRAVLSAWQLQVPCQAHAGESEEG